MFSFAEFRCSPVRLSLVRSASASAFGSSTVPRGPLNWSITLEVHEIIVSSRGVYQRIRHPIFVARPMPSVRRSSFRTVAGPELIAFAILFALRVRAEEKMMSEASAPNTPYSARTKRLFRASGGEIRRLEPPLLLDIICLCNIK
jgi:protein-S-isoprenylcysteine O-methyltransferase Ste14